MPFYRFRELIGRVRDLKKELSISPVKRGNDKDRRRITIAVLWEYLKLGGDVDQAYFFESEVYHSLKKCNLCCDPPPEERRLEELERINRARHIKTRRVNPLKLVSEGREPGSNEEPDPLVREIIRILLEEEVRANGISRDNSREGPHKGPRYIKECPRPFKKKERVSLYKPHQVRPGLL